MPAVSTLGPLTTASMPSFRKYHAAQAQGEWRPKPPKTPPHLMDARFAELAGSARLRPARQLAERYAYQLASSSSGELPVGAPPVNALPCVPQASVVAIGATNV